MHKGPGSAATARLDGPGHAALNKQGLDDFFQNSSEELLIGTMVCCFAPRPHEPKRICHSGPG